MKSFSHLKFKKVQRIGREILLSENCDETVKQTPFTLINKLLVHTFNCNCWYFMYQFQTTPQ